MESQLGVGGIRQNFFIRVRTRSSVLPKQTGDDFERSYLARSLIRFDVGLQYLFLFLEHTKKPLPLLKLLFSQKSKDATWNFSVVGSRVHLVGFHRTRESSTVAPLHCTLILSDCIMTHVSFDTCMLLSMLRSLTTPPNTDELAASLRNLCESSRTVASYPPTAISSRIAPSPHL